MTDRVSSAGEQRAVNQVSPAIDNAILPTTGATRDGHPVSINRAPPPDLAPWIARFYATGVTAPDDHVVSCGLFNDLPFVRIQLGGEWTAQGLDGPSTSSGGAQFFGPHSRRMPVSVRGGFLSFGFALRPGAMRALGVGCTTELVDRVMPCEAIGGSSLRWMRVVTPEADPVQLLDRLEQLVRRIVGELDPARPDPATQAFEHAAWTDPSIAVRTFAEAHGIDQRRLERVVKRDFGMSPKAVLRRARALDMAAMLRGVADNDEAEELALRFYDQSHLNREFTQLFGMSPRQFASRPQPLMTAALENRQSRRLEMMARIAPGAARPWMLQDAAAA